MTLKDWWKAACTHGTIYYITEHISRTGMGAAYTLYTIAEHDGKPYLALAWPDDENGYNEKLAKALGFRMRKVGYRAWYRGGCGYDRVRDVIDSIGRYAEPDGKDRQNRIYVEGLRRDS